MKVTLDLDDLVKRGEITPEESRKLARLAAQDTGSLGSNILLAFGMIAVAVGGGFLFPTAESVIVMGAILLGIGLALVLGKQTRWTLVAQVSLVLGALGVAGGVSYLTNGDFYVNLALAIGLGGVAFLARSGLLAALAILQLSLAMGSGTSYWSASYFVWVERPAVTIAVLAIVAIALYQISLRLDSAYERVAIIGARTAVLLINLAFLVGSLFGDRQFNIEASWFSIVWAALLIGVGLWGVAANRRWVVNAAAIFGALHFYTQWFEYLGPTPFSVLGAGILLIVFGLALRWFNKWLAARRTQAV